MNSQLRMNFLKSFSVSILRLGLLACLFSLASCAMTREDRGLKNQTMFVALPPAEKARVRAGKIEAGMAKDGVFLSWGDPDKRGKGSKNGSEFETWTYIEYKSRVRHSYNFGYSPYYGYGYRRGCYGGWGGVYDHYVDYVPVRSAQVFFQKGRVSSWQEEEEL